MSSDRRTILAESLAAIERLQSRLDAAEAAKHEPIAIVGAACRYPGGAETPEQLWTLVRDGVDAVDTVPAERWNADDYYDADPKAPGKMITKRGGFLRQVDQFDPASFGISPREAQSMDPQQRLLLETSLEALEVAAIAPDTLVGSSTGVFVGITTSDYGQLVHAGGVGNSDVYSATGNALNAAAGRIAFTFGLQGPTVAVDTACSSSLVAVHLACRALRNGEADLALAGGVNIVLSPDAMILFSKWGMLAPDGRCKTFDASADGFVRAEGAAMIVLKRLSSARADGDPILAVIRGSAVNQDGRSSGLTVPNGPAQQAVLRRALADARLEPKDIDYVEAHGTGTPLGDPIELEALGAVMGAGRPSDRPLLVGSIKTNIGHAEAASGLAGLLKVVMGLRHEAIAPHLHFSRPNPGIPWERLSLAVPTTLTPWPRGERIRRAGVSSFGFSGTNAHVILEEAPADAITVEGSPDGPVLLPLSARDDEALRAVATRTADFIAEHPGVPIADIAWTAATGRAHLTHRIAIVADNTGDLKRDLRAFASGDSASTAMHGSARVGERPKIAFLFTGQGAQYAGMGRGLYDAEPVFRAAIDRANKTLTPLLGRSLIDVLFPSVGMSTPLGETAYTQPALFALEYALTELWRSWGITPSVVLGHSVGEYVAACVAGVMSLEDGLALIAERGRLMQALPAGGGMAAVFTNEARVAPLIAGHRDRLAIAAINGPEETVVSGDADALADVLTTFSAEGIASRRLDVSHAFHSPRLDPMLDALERRAATVTFSQPRLSLISNLTGRVFAPGTAPNAAYWRRHAREPVRFADGLDALRAAGVSAVIEIGPHPTLLALAGRSIPQAPWISVTSLRRQRDDRREMLAALGALYARGAAVSWAAVEGHRVHRRLSLPTYPFQRQRHWIDAAPARAAGVTRVGHPLLGERRELAASPGTYVWETDIGLESHPWLSDHRVQGAAIVPATAYIEMSLAAVGEVWGAGPVVAEQIVNLAPLVLQTGSRRRIQTTLTVNGGSADVTVHSREGTSPFATHITARLAMADARIQGTVAGGRSGIDAIRARCNTKIEGDAFYASRARDGNQWGATFRGMREVWIGDGEAIGRVQVPTGLLGDISRYRFHPGVADACGHALVAAAPSDPNSATSAGAFVGGGVEQVRFYGSPAGTTLWTHARLRPESGTNERIVIGDVRVYDDSGDVVSETLGVRLWNLDESTGGAVLGVPDDWFYEVQWRREARGIPMDRAAKNGTWLVFADDSGIADCIAARRDVRDARTVLVTVGHQYSQDGDRVTIRPDEPGDIARLLEAVAPTAVIHLWSLNLSSESIRSSGVENVLHLLHGVLRANARPRLWLVSADSQPVVGTDHSDALAAAAVWGLGRTISAEHAELWGGLVDVQRAASADSSAADLVREVESADAEDKVAFRDGHRYVPRLERARLSTGSGVAINGLGTYLVTGGLGGLGLAMARRLVEKGARHLLLLGRTPIPPRESWGSLDPATTDGERCVAIAGLEALGARIETAAVDVSVDSAIERCVEARRKRGEPAVCGVIHAAGVAHVRSLDAEDIPSVRAAVAAKIDGAWLLHNLFADQPLDFFVLCSSASALAPLPHLGVYAAGNAFLDALAHHRRAMGRTALSVNWGLWGEVGMGVEGSRSKGTVLSRMGRISTVRGLAALERLIESGAVQVAVMPIERDELARSYGSIVSDRFLSSLVNASVAPAHPRAPAASTSSVGDAAGDDRAAWLLAYLRGEAAKSLGTTPERLDPAAPLSSLGFDSLMAVQLKNQIEYDLGVVVPMIQFLQSPSVEQLAPAVQSIIAAAESERGSAVAANIDGWETGTL